MHDTSSIVRILTFGFGWEIDLAILIISSIVIGWLLYHYLVRSGYAKLTFQPTEFHQAVLAQCKHIHTQYWGTPWLVTGDLLSILATFFRSHPHPYRREQIPADDGALLNLDWLEPSDASEDAPVLLVLPGITGHSKSGYLVHMVEGAYNIGWRTVVLVYPGTDLSKVKTARFIRTHVIHDLDITLQHIRKYKPKADIYAVAYSMGASLLSKYLAHYGNRSLIKAAVSCSNPFDVLYSVKRMQKGIINSLYNIHFVAAMKKMWKINKEVFMEAFPHLTQEDVHNFARVEDFDHNITIKTFGFDNVDDYYIALGCKDSIEHVSVPLLVAHAADDPIVSMDAIPEQTLLENPNIVTVITKMGGHTGWLQGLYPMGPSWLDQVAIEWLHATHRYLNDSQTLSYSKQNGFSKTQSLSRPKRNPVRSPTSSRRSGTSKKTASTPNGH